MDITLTKNEILCSRNEPAQFRLALVLVDEQGARSPQYLTGYTFGEPVESQILLKRRARLVYTNFWRVLRGQCKNEDGGELWFQRSGKN